MYKYNTVYFYFLDQILRFADRERYKSVDVMILDDDIPEGDEKFQLILTNPSPGLELGENTIGRQLIIFYTQLPPLHAFFIIWNPV